METSWIPLGTNFKPWNVNGGISYVDYFNALTKTYNNTSKYLLLHTYKFEDYI